MTIELELNIELNSIEREFATLFSSPSKSAAPAELSRLFYEQNQLKILPRGLMPWLLLFIPTLRITKRAILLIS